MEPNKEDLLLQSVALQNAQAIRLARRRAEQELVRAKEELEQKTLELSRSLAMVRATLESTTDAILATDQTGAVTGFNEHFLKLWGFSASSPELTDHRQIVKESSQQLRDPDEFLGRIDEIYASSTVESHDVLDLEDGRVIERFSRLQVLEGENVGRVWSFRDITERMEAEKQLSRLAAIVESSLDAIISKDLNGIISSWNSGAERLFGYKPEEAIGRPITILIPDDRIAEEPNIISRIRRGERVEHFETVRRRKDGTLLDISLTVSPIVDANGQVVGASKIARDITERRRAEKAARDSEIMLRVIEAQEAERHKIARDIHDQLGQRMTGLRFKIESLIASSEAYPEVSGHAAEVREMASKIDQDIGFLSWELRPTELESVGLEDALRSFVREWSKQYGIAAEFHSNISSLPSVGARLSQTVETNVYRIVQEGLNNVLKHAKADRVSVILRPGNKVLALVIEDDGCGFDAEKDSRSARKFGGQGLIGIRERAAMLGGSLAVESKPGEGTTILVRIPTF